MRTATRRPIVERLENRQYASTVTVVIDDPALHEGDHDEPEIKQLARYSGPAQLEAIRLTMTVDVVNTQYVNGDSYTVTTDLESAFVMSDAEPLIDIPVLTQKTSVFTHYQYTAPPYVNSETTYVSPKATASRTIEVPLDQFAFFIGAGTIAVNFDNAGWADSTFTSEYGGMGLNWKNRTAIGLNLKVEYVEKSADPAPEPPPTPVPTKPPGRRKGHYKREAVFSLQPITIEPHSQLESKAAPELAKSL